MQIINQETYYDLKQRQKSTISPNTSNILLEIENNKIRNDLQVTFVIKILSTKIRI